jgi:hypothetical protein
MKTRDELSTLTASDVEHVAVLAQGMNELRAWLRVGGRLGTARSVAEERAARAVMDGLSDGWYLCGDQGECFEGEDRLWYLAALDVATRLAPPIPGVAAAR